MKEEAKWDLLYRIQDNTEAWENDKGRKSGINYDYECIKSFMGTDNFRDISNKFGLDSQSIANYFKAFAYYIEIPKKKLNKYHAPYKDVVSHVPVRSTQICTTNHIVPEPHVEKMPSLAKVKEYSMIISANNKGTMKTVEPGKHLSDEPVSHPKIFQIL